MLGPGPALQDLRRAADHAPQRVVDHDRADAGHGLDPAGQAGQQRAAARQPDLAAHDILGQARRDLGQHLGHRPGDGRDDRAPARWTTIHPGTFSDRGLRCAMSRPTTSAQPSAPPVTPSVIFSCRAARWLMMRPSSVRAACTIASSMALPALRSDRARTTRQPATAATSVVPPPMSTTNPPAPPVRSNPAPAAAATGSSISRTLYRGRRTLSAATMDRRSTGGRAAGHADQRVRPQPGEPAGPPQERVQHGRGRVQVGDHSVPQRVDHLDALRLLVGQRVGRLTHRRDLADRGVDGDRGGLLDHDAAARHPDERVDRAEINRHATPEAHVAPLCPKVTPLNPRNCDPGPPRHVTVD